MALHNHNAKGDGSAEARNVLAGMRAAQALQLRKLGFTYDTIAQQCGYKDRGAAHHAVMRELKRTIQEPAEDLRHLEVERLDALMTAFMPRALKGDNGAVDRVLRIMERRAGLLGLDLHDTATVTIPRGKRIVIEDAEAVPLPPAMIVPADAEPAA